MSQVSWLLILVVLVAFRAEAAPQDSGPPPDADFLEFIGSWHTGDDRWVDPFRIGGGPDLAPGAKESASRRPKAGGQTNKPPEETNQESNRKGIDVIVPQRDVQP
ncbi:MAG: hypothetical protein ABIR36_04470 [Nitrospiraceae bacterium]